MRTVVDLYRYTKNIPRFKAGDCSPLYEPIEEALQLCLDNDIPCADVYAVADTASERGRVFGAYASRDPYSLVSQLPGGVEMVWDTNFDYAYVSVDDIFVIAWFYADSVRCRFFYRLRPQGC